MTPSKSSIELRSPILRIPNDGMVDVFQVAPDLVQPACDWKGLHQGEVTRFGDGGCQGVETSDGIDPFALRLFWYWMVDYAAVGRFAPH